MIFFGLPRLWGYLPALIQGPVSRFGDTAANAGMLALMDSYTQSHSSIVRIKFAFLGGVANVLIGFVLAFISSSIISMNISIIISISISIVISIKLQVPYISQVLIILNYRSSY